MTTPNSRTYMNKAERLLEQANAWEDADTGWKRDLTTEERLQRKALDLAEAQVFASLAEAAAKLEVWR